MRDGHGRRTFLSRAGVAGLIVGAGGRFGGLAHAQSCERTEPNIEGPFYRPGAPVGARLTPEGRGGIRFSGRVRTSACGVARNAVLEVWHADAEGDYDLQGYRYRTTLRADAAGRYRFTTIRPGRYLNGPTYRPAHIHVKVHADGMQSLTTQLYFAGDPYNDGDPWIRDSLIVQPRRGCHPTSHVAFDFVL